MFGRDRRATVHHDQPYLFAGAGNLDSHDGPALSMARCVRQQVGQRPLQQRGVEVTRGFAGHHQVEACFGVGRLVVVGNLERDARQAIDSCTARMRTPVALRQEQHVLHDARDTLQVLEVGTQHLAQFLRASGFSQGEFCASDQRRQRSAQFVRDVGVESLELLVRSGQTR